MPAIVGTIIGALWYHIMVGKNGCDLPVKEAIKKRENYFKNSLTIREKEFIFMFRVEDDSSARFDL